MSLIALCVVLVGLALLDSTTFGTLLIPLWLLLAPGRLRLSRIALYLATVASSYFVIGVALQFGADALLDAYRDALTSRPAFFVQFFGGLALIIVASVLNSKPLRARAGRQRREQSAAENGILVRLRQRAVVTEQSGSVTTILTVALLAVGLEVATMFPYLGAIGLMSQHGPGFPTVLLLLAGYCMVMVVPAAALTAARARWGTEFDEPLRWIEEQTGSATMRSASLWMLAVLGAVVTVNAAFTLWF